MIFAVASLSIFVGLIFDLEKEHQRSGLNFEVIVANKRSMKSMTYTLI